MRILKWIWDKGVVGTFLAGLFSLLPILITLGVVAWLAGWFVGILGPGTWIGSGLKFVGLKFVTNEIVAYILGLTLVVAGIWGFGLLARSQAKGLAKQLLEIPKIPLVNSIYGTVQQVVQMLNRDGGDENLKKMEVVYCYWEDDGGGFLALSPTGVYKFGEEPCRSVYIPTSPMPVTGGCIFWPVKRIMVVPDMAADAVMQVYMSLGVLANQAVPLRYHHETIALSMLREQGHIYGPFERQQDGSAVPSV